MFCQVEGGVGGGQRLHRRGDSLSKLMSFSPRGWGPDSVGSEQTKAQGGLNITAVLADSFSKLTSRCLCAVILRLQVFEIFVFVFHSQEMYEISDILRLIVDTELSFIYFLLTSMSKEALLTFF